MEEACWNGYNRTIRMGVWEGYFATANIAIRYVLIFPILDNNACKTIVSYTEDKSTFDF